jgi:hypothetical protein
MSSHTNPSELVKDSIKVAIERANKEREEFNIAKEKYQGEYIETKIKKLGSLITRYPTDKSKWCVDVFLDMDTLKRVASDLESRGKWRAAQSWRGHIMYYDPERIKNTFIELGYGIEEKETIVYKFLCIPDYKRKVYQLYIK